jgi:hypothetical protein
MWQFNYELSHYFCRFFSIFAAVKIMKFGNFVSDIK